MTEIGSAYGGALFSLAHEEQLDDVVLEHLSGVCALMDENPDFVRLMSTPTLQKARRVEILGETFGGRVHEYVHSFLCILVQNGTFRELPECLAEYRRQYNAAHNIAEVTAVTAVPLSAEQQQALRDRLAASTGRRIELTNRIDPKTIGGVVLEMEGKRIDGSIRSRLEAVRDDLLKARA